MKKIILILLLTSNLYAYRLNSVAENGARWPSLPIRMELNTTNSGLSEDEVVSAIERAMSTWNTSLSKDVLAVSDVNTSFSPSEVMDFNDRNLIGFSKNFRTDSHGFDPDVVVAVGGQYGNGTRMRDGFVLFNSEGVIWMTESERGEGIGYVDHLETIALHEFGHVIGLGHSEKTEAVMAGSRTTLIKTILTQDDIDGALYLTSAATGSGEDAPRFKDYGGCGMVKNVSGSDNGNSANTSLFILLPFLLLIIKKIRLLSFGFCK